MKRRFGVLLAVLAMCLTLAVPVYAANERPAVELMSFISGMGSDGWYSPDLYFKINATKTVKYLDWYFTLYNRVDDPTPNEITHDSTVHLQLIGPIEPDTSIKTNPAYGSPKETGRYILSSCRDVFIDRYGNYFFYAEGYYKSIAGELQAKHSITYLTPDEVRDRTFYQKTSFKKAWYSKVFSYAKLQKVVVTYMDGTSESIDGAIADAQHSTSFHNNYFETDLSNYSAVFNVSDYQNYNPDLVELFGKNNEYKLFEHFVTSGMKEGRQGSKSFNLAAYKANNPDLVAVFGDDNVKYYEHYITIGKAEGRKST